MLIRDASNQRILHRIFTVDDEPFLVTVASKGGELATDVFEPALAALEETLRPRAA